VPELGPDASPALQVRQLFDAKAPTWSAKYAPGGRLTSRLAHLAASVHEHSAPGGAVLDLGCGTGNLAYELARAGFTVTGCDISPEMLARATNTEQTQVVSWIQLDPDWQALPFSHGSFDVVVASSVLEYVKDPVAVLRECARVGRPGGAVLCTVPNLTHPSRWFEWTIHTAIQAPAMRRIGSRSPRLKAYLSYLATSRQRHGARWWYSAGRSAGLQVSNLSARTIGHGPLRLLTFRLNSCAGGDP
jgi:ubiquinone/menaquinone biosynthesis C-methylase UbiE